MAAEAGDAHAGLAQPTHELFPLVAQWVVLGGDDQGRGQVRESVREQRRKVGVLEVGRVGGVLLPVPGGLARVEPVSVGAVGVERRGRVEEGVDQRHRAVTRSGRRNAATRARLPPALSPWSNKGPASSGWAPSQSRAVSTSSIAAGKRASGARR